MTRFLLALAGLMGASDIAAWAAAAHLAAGTSLDTAAYMLLFHAPAITAIALALREGAIHRFFGLMAAEGLALGAVLFSSDLALRSFMGTPLFRLAAPIGGMIVIAGWLLLAVAALAAPRAPTP
jgi:uncharacterized membrane protein YgdD (TMEM256/DUF423 family)